MPADPQVTISGTLIGDPELHTGSSGVPVATFTLACTHRIRRGGRGRWINDDTLHLDCVAFRQLAEHTAELLARDQRVIVVGRLQQRSYHPDHGETRSSIQLIADDIGPSLRGTALPEPAMREFADDPMPEYLDGPPLAAR